MIVFEAHIDVIKRTGVNPVECMRFLTGFARFGSGWPKQASVSRRSTRLMTRPGVESATSLDLP